VRSPLQEVTSLSFAAYGEDGKGMLVTGGHDGLTRLWTLDGCLIGTFGVDLWQCDNPTTFVDEQPEYRLHPDEEYAADPPAAVREAQEVRAPVRSNNVVTHFLAPPLLRLLPPQRGAVVKDGHTLVQLGLLWAERCARVGVWPQEATAAVVAALRRPATATQGEAEEEEMTQEEYERLTMQHKRAALYKSLSGKKGGGKDAKPPSNPFNAILDRRLKLKPIAPVEPPLANFKRMGLK
jgi:hypothetical protein